MARSISANLFKIIFFLKIDLKKPTYVLCHAIVLYHAMRIAHKILMPNFQIRLRMLSSEAG